MLRIVSWNIRQGGGKRIRKIAQALVEMGGHIVVLSEYRNGASGEALRAALLKQGYRHQLVTDAPDSSNSVLLASKLSFDSRKVSESIAYRDNLVIADFEAFSIVGGYWPHKKHHKLFEEALRIHQQSSLPLIVAGDFNAGINGLDQAGNSFWYEKELVRMQSAGLKDAFREKHGITKEYSWFSHQGNGFRYDHTYIDQVLVPVLRACYYEHTYRQQGLSDHSPMILELS